MASSKTTENISKLFISGQGTTENWPKDEARENEDRTDSKRKQQTAAGKGNNEGDGLRQNEDQELSRREQTEQVFRRREHIINDCSEQYPSISLSNSIEYISPDATDSTVDQASRNGNIEEEIAMLKKTLNCRVCERHEKSMFCGVCRSTQYCYCCAKMMKVCLNCGSMFEKHGLPFKLLGELELSL